MQKLKVGDTVRISSRQAAREHGISLFTLGRVTWKGDRSDVLEVNIGDRRVMVRSTQLEKVRLR